MEISFCLDNIFTVITTELCLSTQLFLMEDPKCEDRAPKNPLSGGLVQVNLPGTVFIQIIFNLYWKIKCFWNWVCEKILLCQALCEWMDSGNCVQIKIIFVAYELRQQISVIWLCSLCFNSLGPGDAIWPHRSGSTLVQVIACCLTAPSHYLNQCWLIISKIQWHSSQGNFTRYILAINHICLLENYLSKISVKSPRGQWVNIDRYEAILGWVDGALGGWGVDVVGVGVGEIPQASLSEVLWWSHHSQKTPM